ncbi:hypothetical protein NQZ68_012408 [Dissostichus eleginoides]|nr:hypothetical protein NQZ68_012408 [Dissostichus eleginoides]
MPLLKLLFLVLLTRRVMPVCRLQGRAQPPELSKAGDFVLGGIFTFQTGYIGSIPSFQTLPDPPKCLNINVREFKFAQTMIFAIEEINQNPAFLPNLGYKIYNSCGMTNMIKSALDLANGQREIIDERNCTKADTALAILGHSASAPTVGFARIMGRFQIPVISHFATCACLSNREEFPSFFRTIPSDLHQSRALAKLVKHFGWTWVGAISNKNDYGVNGMASFIQAAQEEGVCIEYYEAFDQTGPLHDLNKVVETVKHSTSMVIVAFMSHREVKVLATELYRQNITGLQLVGSDAWITDHSLTDSEGRSILVGSLGFVVSKAQIPGLEEHLRQIHPSQFPDIFFHFRETPIVRANNSELSFLLLFSLTLCFLCSLTFIGRPSQWSCMLRHTAFGITFVLCISCVLGKTIVVLMAFRATLPGSNMMKWFGPAQQRLSVLGFTLIQKAA